MDDQKGKYNRLVVISIYMTLVGFVAFLVAYFKLDMQQAKDFLKDAVIPVLGYVVIKGPNATPVMQLIGRKKPEPATGLGPSVE